MRNHNLTHTGKACLVRWAAGMLKRFIFAVVFCFMASAWALTAEEAADLYFSTNSFLEKSPKSKAARSFSDEAPDPTDVCFVVKTGDSTSGNMGTTGKHGLDITFTIPIRRYYGTSDQIQRLIQNGGLPSKATLRMFVLDVDSAGAPGHSPEKDILYVNGGCWVGELYGANNEWRVNKFDIDISELKFPSAPGEVANNTFKIVVDYNNEGWVTKVDWAALEIPAAPPVVISHGIRNSASDVSDLATEIEKLGLPTHTFSYRENGNSSIRDGARQLATEIEKAANRWHVDRITIVGHSMGGLKAREYVSSFDPTGARVDRVIQIATPNRGSYLAAAQQWLEANIDSAPVLIRNAIKKLMWALNYEGPAFYDLLPSSMVAYNEGHPLSENVDYTVIAGNCGHADWSIDSLLSGAALRMIEYGEGDTVVSVSSAHTLVPPNKWSPLKSPYATHSGLVVLSRGMVSVTIASLKDDLLRHKSTKLRKLTNNAKKAHLTKRSSRTVDDKAEENSPAYFLFGTSDKTLSVNSIPFSIRNRAPTRLCFFIEEEDANSISLVSPSGIVYSDTSSSILIQDIGFFKTVLIAAPEPGIWSFRCWECLFTFHATEGRWDCAKFRVMFRCRA